jgi:hypothetical protein
MSSGNSPYFQQIIDNQQTLLRELQAIHSILKERNANKQNRRSSTVNQHVKALLY